MDDTAIQQGRRNGYQWLTSTEHYSGTLLKACPEIFIDRYLAITCIDGGTRCLQAIDNVPGWETRQGIAYSPKLDRVTEIPHQVDGSDGPGYDEFYTFERECDLGKRVSDNIFLEPFAPAPGRTAVFVTWAAFLLYGSNDLVDLFWPQLQRIQPESYIADGSECLTFVSRNQLLFELVHERLSALLVP
jgi:hypothetical protein